MKPQWVLIAPDVFPFSKAGGISDYIYSFAAALRDEGYSVDIYSPYYEHLMLEEFHRQSFETNRGTIPFLSKHMDYEVHSTSFEGISYHFIRNAEYFGHSTIYTKGGVYNQNLTYFSYLGKCMLHDLAHRTTSARHPELILQGNDIFASLFAAYVKKEMFPNQRVTTVFCMHNLGQGYIAEKSAFDYRFMDAELQEAFADVHKQVRSWSEAILPCFDKIITVSDTYAKELTHGPTALHAALAQRRQQGDFGGFINGIDHSFWSVQTSPLLEEQSAGRAVAERKRQYKQELCSSSGFDPDKPLFAFVGRISRQKGLETLGSALQAHPDMQLIVLGQGEPLRQWIEPDPAHRMVHMDMYTELLCHRVMAGADYLFVPSHYEPCGLVAMYGARFGAVPIVRRTGGLIEIAQQITAQGGRAVMFDSDASCAEQVGLLLAEDCPSEETACRLSELRWEWKPSIEALERFLDIGSAKQLEGSA